MQVRKSSQEVLLILLEQDLIFQHDIESKVCPIWLALSAPTVMIICKLASELSNTTVERLLLPRFCEPCGFQVRKVCATNFGDICHAVGQEATEKFLARQAAFQSLGPFIFTFANPSRAGLYSREDGTLTPSIGPPAPYLDSDFTSGSPRISPPGAGSHGNMSSAW
eukprot:XP_028354237.1 putative serine/threonine-protein phosphatase 4 regulatory subunit 1-like isoform X1 [Physeter catodon]